jgi:rhamnulokinase
MTADAIGADVVAGPMECTAAGNIMVQAKAAGEVGSLTELRGVIARSNETATFHPADTGAWEAAYDTYLDIIKKANS